MVERQAHGDRRHKGAEGLALLTGNRLEVAGRTSLVLTAQSTLSPAGRDNGHDADDDESEDKRAAAVLGSQHREAPHGADADGHTQRRQNIADSGAPIFLFNCVFTHSKTLQYSYTL